MKNRIWIWSLAIMGAMLILGSACKKDDDSDDNNTDNNNNPPEATTVTDIDGNVYNIVTIGTQKWMKENLNVKHYRNGDAIQYYTGSGAGWAASTTGACCYFNNDPNGGYGLLYNGYAVYDSRNIAPTGWHVATDDDWATLITYLGGSTVAGGKLKATGTVYWESPNTGATNSSGFTALGGGYRETMWGYFWNDRRNAFFWAVVPGTDDNYRELSAFGAEIYSGRYSNGTGMSVRCVKD